jgi:hypothetical protein
MNLKESKRVKTLCRLSPSFVSCVKYLKLNNGRCITVFSAGNKLLHIMENYKIIVSFFIKLFVVLVYCILFVDFVDYLKYLF